jgi:hypothetical protein
MNFTMNFNSHLRDQLVNVTSPRLPCTFELIAIGHAFVTSHICEDNSLPRAYKSTICTQHSEELQESLSSIQDNRLLSSDYTDMIFTPDFSLAENEQSPGPESTSTWPAHFTSPSEQDSPEPQQTGLMCRCYYVIDNTMRARTLTDTTSCCVAKTPMRTDHQGPLLALRLSMSRESTESQEPLGSENSPFMEIFPVPDWLNHTSNVIVCQRNETLSSKLKEE